MTTKILLAASTATLTLLGLSSVCLGQAPPATQVVRLQVPDVPCDDVHITNNEWFKPTFDAINPVDTISISGGTAVPFTHGSGINITFTGSIRDQVLLMRINTTGFSWDELTGYFTDGGHAIPGQNFTPANSVMFLVSGVHHKMIEGGVDGRTWKVSAASNTGASVSQILFASSANFYATPEAVESAGILAAVTPTNTVLGVDEAEIFSTIAGAPYSYSKTVFSDGTYFYGAAAVVPAPSGLCLLAVGSVMAVRRRRR